MKPGGQVHPDAGDASRLLIEPSRSKSADGVIWGIRVTRREDAGRRGRGPSGRTGGCPSDARERRVGVPDGITSQIDRANGASSDNHSGTYPVPTPVIRRVPPTR